MCPASFGNLKMAVNTPEGIATGPAKFSVLSLLISARLWAARLAFDLGSAADVHARSIIFFSNAVDE